MRQAAMRFGLILSQTVVTVPNHSGDMPEGTLRAILKQANISADDFLTL